MRLRGCSNVGVPVTGARRRVGHGKAGGRQYGGKHRRANQSREFHLVLFNANAQASVSWPASSPS